MRRNVWIAGLTILFAAGTLTMAPAFAFAAETLPQGIYAGELDLAGVPAGHFFVAKGGARSERKGQAHGRGGGEARADAPFARDSRAQPRR